MKKEIKVVVCGYGHLGKWHCQKVDSIDKSTLFAIVDPNETSRENASKAHPNAKVVENLNEVINDIDAAVVVTPTSTHFELVKQLIESHKHVFCEKPLTVNHKEALELKNLAEKTDLTVQVGHSERFHEIFERRLEFKDFFEGKATIKLNRLAPFKGRATDVDVVQDLMIHDLDLLVHLFDEIPVSVNSSGYKIRTDKWDYVCSNFKFDSGRSAIITVGRNHIKEVRELEITNKAGCLLIDLFRNEVLIARGDAALESDFVKSEKYNKRDHLLIEQNHFYDSITNTRPPIVSIKDGETAIRLLDKVLLSLENEEEVIF